MHTKTALIVEGGANRSIFSAGLLDGLKQADFQDFDFYIGVSGGAYNLINYLNSNNIPSNTLYKKILQTPKLVNVWRFISGGHLIDIDILNTTLQQHTESLFDIEQDKLDRLYITATCVDSGNAKYIRCTPKNLLAALKATASLPLFYRDISEVNGSRLLDGGIADGIPISKAIKLGANRIVIIRARHYGYKKSDTPVHRYIRWYYRQHDALVNTMKNRIKLYNNSIALIKNPPDGTEIIEICPPTDFKMNRFSCTEKDIDQGYLLGKLKADHLITRWS